MSLHYAFIEYEDAKCCEAAYFKMDNVLIDDRRIHVDFSQSVAKNYTWNKKGNTNKGAPACRVRALFSDAAHSAKAPPPPRQQARNGGGEQRRTDDRPRRSEV
jgi:RNA recognition motif-containing protein